MLAKFMTLARSRSFRNVITSVAISVLLTSCTKKGSTTDSQVQSGIASWYGQPFNGRLTASGEIFDMTRMTAAHRTFPFGTVLSVKNLSNGRQTEVRVNDRGPFVQGRIIDLSYAAAQGISMPGIAQVELRVVSIPTQRDADVYAVQVGEYAKKVEAERVRAQLGQRFSETAVIYRNRDQTWCVLVGRQPNLESVTTLASQLDREMAVPAFVVRLDPQ